jgi:hypothetical protein
VLYDGMVAGNVGVLTRHVIYWAVRAFGWLAWLRNQEDKESGSHPFDRVQKRAAETGHVEQRPGQYAQLRRRLARTFLKRA